MNTICIISVYFGKFNNYFELWLRSCSYNKNIDFKIYSDIVYERSLVEYIQTPPNCLTLNSIAPNHYAFRSTIAA